MAITKKLPNSTEVPNFRWKVLTIFSGMQRRWGANLVAEIFWLLSYFGKKVEKSLFRGIFSVHKGLLQHLNVQTFPGWPRGMFNAIEVRYFAQRMSENPIKCLFPDFGSSCWARESERLSFGWVPSCLSYNINRWSVFIHFHCIRKNKKSAKLATVNLLSSFFSQSFNSKSTLFILTLLRKIYVKSREKLKWDLKLWLVIWRAQPNKNVVYGFGWLFELRYDQLQKRSEALMFSCVWDENEFICLKEMFCRPVSLVFPYLA